jgi:hypothetical protein
MADEEKIFDELDGVKRMKRMKRMNKQSRVVSGQWSVVRVGGGGGVLVGDQPPTRADRPY